MNESHYGWKINCYYDWLNMLNSMKQKNPQRFKEFQYSNSTIYDYLVKLEHEQHIHD